MRPRLFALAAAALVAGCTDLSFTPAIDRITTPIANPSFANDIAPVLAQTCASSGACHGGPTPQKGLSLLPESAYVNLVNVAGQYAPAQAPWLVRPLFADSSLFFRVLSTDPAVRLSYYRMPLTSTPLPSPIVQTIQNWINLGAANN